MSSRKYIEGYWPHHFACDGKERIARILLDHHERSFVQGLVQARVEDFFTFVPATSEQLSELEAAVLKVHPDVFTTPSDYGLEPTDDLIWKHS